jgi:hypothetical protein
MLVNRNNYKPFSFKYNKNKYFIVGAVFLLSTSVYFTANVAFLATAFFIFGFMFLNRKYHFNNDFIAILLALTILHIANIIIYDFFSFRTVAGNYIRFLVPFFAVLLVGRNFPVYFVKVVKVFTIISFIFYVPANVIPGFNELLQNIPRFLGTDPGESNHFIIYQVEAGTAWGLNIPVLRNSGPTGEPGEFAGYLVLAMIFELVLAKQLWTKNNILFFIALLTTFSTAGYMGFFILISAHYLLFRNRTARFILFPLSVLLALSVYFSLEFMYQKVDVQIGMVTSAQSIKDVPRTGRIPNLIRNFNDSFDNPLFGKGRSFETRYGSNYKNLKAQSFSNNMAAFPVQFGWPFFLFYSFLMIKGFKALLLRYNMKQSYAYVFLLIIYTMAIAQGFLMTSVFISLIYLRGVYPILSNSEFKVSGQNIQ